MHSDYNLPIIVCNAMKYLLAFIKLLTLLKLALDIQTDRQKDQPTDRQTDRHCQV